MPQLEQTHTFISQIFWLIVSFSLLYFLMRFLLIPRLLGILDRRANQVASDLERATTARQDAVEVLSAYERVINESRIENDKKIKAILDEQAEIMKAENGKLQQELNQKFMEAEQRIKASYEKAFSEIEAEIEPVVNSILEKSSDKLVNASKTRVLAEMRKQ